MQKQILRIVRRWPGSNAAKSDNPHQKFLLKQEAIINRSIKNHFAKGSVNRPPVPADKILTTYRRYRLEGLLSVFFGYAGYYVVRSNFTLATPHMMDAYNFTKSEIGLLMSTMLVVYGLAKFVMGSLADKSNVKVFMAVGLVLSALLNLAMGFSVGFWAFTAFVALNGIFQAMGVAPSFITLANWFPGKMRAKPTGLWFCSHNIGAAVTAPLIGGSLALLGTGYWQYACFIVPAAVAVIIALGVLKFGKGAPENEGLPSLREMGVDDGPVSLAKEDAHYGLTERRNGVLWEHVLKNKHFWLVTTVAICGYIARMGLLSWMPIYLIKVKHFGRSEMSFAFAVFEFAAIPSTLFAGWLVDKLFKGKSIPLSIMSLAVVFGAVAGYWLSDELLVITASAAIAGCFIYLPLFLTAVRTMEVVPACATGSAFGTRGLCEYLIGSVIGTAGFGFIVDKGGWDAGFILLLGSCLLGIIFCFWSNFCGYSRADVAIRPSGI